MRKSLAEDQPSSKPLLELQEHKSSFRTAADGYYCNHAHLCPESGIIHILAISGQHVAVLTAMVYLVLRLFAVPTIFRNPTVLALMWLYIFIAGAPPSAIRAGVVATFVLATPLFGRQLSPM